MTDRNFYSLSNFDFLARSFAQMESEGLTVDLHAVTGNMNEEQRLWFFQRYEHYRQQAHARERESQEK